MTSLYVANTIIWSISSLLWINLTASALAYEDWKAVCVFAVPSVISAFLSVFYLMQI